MIQVALVVRMGKSGTGAIEQQRAEHDSCNQLGDNDGLLVTTAMTDDMFEGCKISDKHAEGEGTDIKRVGQGNCPAQCCRGPH